MYLSQTDKEDLKLNPGQLEEVFASSDFSEEFDPAAIDEILNEGDFLDSFDEEYDNRSDFFALRLLGRINGPEADYDDPSDIAEYGGDYLDDNAPEQVPYPLRALDEDNEDSNGPNLRLVEEDSNEEDVIPGEEPEDQLESDEEPEEELSKDA